MAKTTTVFDRYDNGKLASVGGLIVLILVVAGAFFGDEGKGKTIAAIARHPEVGLIARVNSGENAGHTVVDLDGTEYVFHLAPSGLLVPGKINVIGPNCVMDPVSFMENEIRQLIDHGKGYNTLVVGNVQIVTPYHKLVDALGLNNSSTLKGISPVHASKVTKKGLRLDDLFSNNDAQARILQRDIEYYEALLRKKELSDEILLGFCQDMNANRIRIPNHVIQFLYAKDKIEFLIDLYEKKVRTNSLFPRRGDVTRLIQKTLEERKKVLIEGAQGYFLSNNDDQTN